MKLILTTVLIICSIFQSSAKEKIDTSFFHADVSYEKNMQAYNHPEKFTYLRDSIEIHIQDIDGVQVSDTLLRKLELKFSQETGENELYLDGDLLKEKSQGSLLFLIIVVAIVWCILFN